MRLTLPRFTIERLRTTVLIGGGLLIAAIAIFLAAGQWKLRKAFKDVPHRLGIDIQQKADGVDYSQSRKGKTLFKIHAARAVQMKAGNKMELHDVRIDLYGEDGNRTDTISGAQFEYDPGAGLAQAAGAVEITLMRPGVKPAIADLKPGSSKTSAAPEVKTPPSPNPTTHPAGDASSRTSGSPLASEITDGEIHVRTSGLTFDQKKGIATTSQRVDFALRQGNGNSTGATYDSSQGQLTLEHAVELHVLQVEHAGNEGSSRPVTVHASHAEFQRTGQVCSLTQARAEYSGGTVQIVNALLHFRDDGSVIRVDGSGGVEIQTSTGGQLSAPRGTLDFDERNHPRNGLLEGGTKMELEEPSPAQPNPEQPNQDQANRKIQGTAPTARLAFDKQGQLRQAHLERGVRFDSEQQATTAKGASAQITRHWQSQYADITFAAAAKVPPGALPSTSAQSQNRIEPRTIHGTGEVTITSVTTGGGTPGQSKLTADTVDGDFAPGGTISSLFGTGHANFEQQRADGVHQTSSSDQLEVHFVSPEKAKTSAAASSATKSKTAGQEGEIASITQTGHVVLVQEQPAKPSTQAASASRLSSSLPGTGRVVRATASRADYDGQKEILHLTGTPRVQDGALDMTANQVDFSRSSDDAVATGDVKASWTNSSNAAHQTPGSSLPGGSLLGSGAGSNEPIHAIAGVAELHQASQDVVFRDTAGKSTANHCRIWQGANSISAPLITLNRQKQTLTAMADGSGNPVRTILVSNPPARSASGKKPANGKPDGPSVIRLRSGELHYSEGERLAVLNSGTVGSVTAETSGSSGTSTVVSQQAEVKLLPAGVHATSTRPQADANNATASSNTSSNTSIESLTARGHVSVDWPGRKGTGEKLVYLSEDGTFTLTGTSAAPPRITDQARGAVTGSALIFHSRDDSVAVEGDGGKTVTETQAPKKASLR